MKDLKDGSYLTHPTHGPKTAVRTVVVKNNILTIVGAGLDAYGREYKFHVFDFFSVNTLISEA